MKFNLKAIHLFLILLGSLIFCGILGGNCNIVEGYTGPAGDTVTVEDPTSASASTTASDPVPVTASCPAANPYVYAGNNIPGGYCCDKTPTNSGTYGPDVLDHCSGNYVKCGKSTCKNYSAPTSQSSAVTNLINSGETALGSLLSGVSQDLNKLKKGTQSLTKKIITTSTSPASSTVAAPASSTVAPAPSVALAVPKKQLQTISSSQIAAGNEDLYILKSQIVPPVCPMCPSNTSCPRQEAPPPCPPCARCPEPSFECKKVPNYSTNNDQYLPRPVLADFSQFGM